MSIGEQATASPLSAHVALTPGGLRESWDNCLLSSLLSGSSSASKPSPWSTSTMSSLPSHPASSSLGLDSHNPLDGPITAMASHGSVSRRVSQGTGTSLGCHPRQAAPEVLPPPPFLSPLHLPTPPTHTHTHRVYSIPGTALSAGETGMNKADPVQALRAIPVYSSVQSSNTDRKPTTHRAPFWRWGYRSEQTQRKPLPPWSLHSR